MDNYTNSRIFKECYIDGDQNIVAVFSDTTLILPLKNKNEIARLLGIDPNSIKAKEELVIFIPSLTPNPDDASRLETALKNRGVNNFIFFNYHDWINDKGGVNNFFKQTDEKFKTIMEKNKDKKITINGHSMGCHLGIYLSTKHKVDNLILSAPAIKLGNVSQNLKDIWSRFVNKDIDYDMDNNYSDEQMSNRMKELKQKFSVRKLLVFMSSIKKAKSALKLCDTRTLVIQGQKDAISSARSGKYILDNLHYNEKKAIFPKQGRHRLFHSKKYSKLIFDEMIKFMGNKEINEDLENEVSVGRSR